MFDQTGNEKIFESKVKKSISWKLVKNCSDSVQRVLFSFFDIASLDGVRGFWSIIIGDDVIAGNGPNQKIFIDFEVFGPTEFRKTNEYFKVYLPSLRSASVPTLPTPASSQKIAKDA